MSDTDSEAKAMEPEQQQEDEEQEEEEGEQEEVPVPVTRSADEAKAVRDLARTRRARDRARLRLVLTPPRGSVFVVQAGNAAFKAGKYADAIEAYSEAITTDPSQPAFYSNRAMCHMKISQWAEARDDGLKASEVDPAFGKGFLRAAQASVQLDAFDEAVTLFGKALAADSSLSSALQEKQKVEDLLRKIAQVEQLLADEEYGRAVAIVTPIVRMGICPESQKLNTMHLQAMVGDRKFAQATTVSASLLRKYGQNPTLVTLRGRCLLYTGQVAAAKQHFKKALQDDPDHRPAQLALKLANKLDRAKEAANTLFKAGKYEEAYAGYTEALEVDPLNDDSNAKVYCNRANTCLKLKRPKDCLADCEQAMKRDGQYAKPYALCGEAHIMIGDQTGDEEAYEQAVRDYDRATDLDPSSQAFDSGLRKAKLELKKSKRKDYYKILELPKDCDDQAAVKKAYRRAALKWHPDKHSGDTEEVRAH
jgi:DnaJ family protein C protein 7